MGLTKEEKLLKIYTPKQLEIKSRVLKSDWRIMVNHGAVRAGKTHINNEVFLDEVRRAKVNALKDGITKPKYILAGVSSKTIYNNVLSDLENDYGFEFKFDKRNQFELFGVTIVMAYTGSIAGLGYVRGFTSYGAYVNEGSLANERVFKEIINRCSGEGARIIVDTNPDHPNHYLKKNYIDKADNDGDNILSYHFTLYDNPFLSKRYIDGLVQNTPSGVFTDRDIKGLWVAGKGQIYTDFDEEVHYVSWDDVPHKELTTFYCGVDWGYGKGHAGVIVVIGETEDGRAYLLNEYAAEGKRIDGWVKVAKGIQLQYGKDTPFYCDSARPEHIDEFEDNGIVAHNADKAVLMGIQTVARRYKERSFFVVQENTVNFDDEISIYAWNEKTGEPLKENDNTMDAKRYALHTHENIDDWEF